MVSINADGTLTVGRINGVWERISGKTIHATSFLQILDAAGNLTGLERHRCILNYSADFNSYEGMEFSETLVCPTPLTCPDPLDPKAPWIVSPWAPPNGFPISGARAEVVAPGPLK